MDAKLTPDQQARLEITKQVVSTYQPKVIDGRIRLLIDHLTEVVMVGGRGARLDGLKKGDDHPDSPAVVLE